MFFKVIQGVVDIVDIENLFNKCMVLARHFDHREHNGKVPRNGEKFSLIQKIFFNDFDYLFAVDADMLFVAPVGSEILSKRVATQHPGFVGKRGTYETNRASAAYVAPQEGKTYFAGGFYGGERESFFSMMETVVANIEQDLHSDYIAIWHDESHLNRYFIDNPPTKILSPSYCYPETWNLPYTKRLLALDKNHHKMRN